MAQVAQMAQGNKPACNTNNNKRAYRGRVWTMTLNNYMESEIKELSSGLTYEYLFQEETGENGTPHLQGVFIFKNPVSLSSLKAMNRRAHWEPARNKIASIRYCCKEDTRSGNIYSNFNYIKYVAHGTMAQPKKEKKKIDIREEVKKQILLDTTLMDMNTHEDYEELMRLEI